MRVFSAIRPSGELHIGNYLGAIRSWLELQKKHECIFAVADYHAITTPFKPEELKQNISDLILDFLALGIDPKKSLIIIQSHIPEHTELTWILNTITPLAWLKRLPTYKEKTEQNPKYNNIGLLDYPVLMASDILLYKTEGVPVGEDQLPHLDITNEIADRFNAQFGNALKRIKAILTPTPKIMSLNDPTKKMSKSLGFESYIGVFEPEEIIREKIKKAMTDSGKKIKYDEENKPAISNLLRIYSELGGLEISAIEKKYQNKGYGDFKKDLAEVIIKYFEAARKKRTELTKKSKVVQKIINDGIKKASKIAQNTIEEVKQKMGLL